MAWNFRVSTARKDMVIRNGKPERVTGAEEVRQRIEIGLNHFLGEYFLNTDAGVPWDQSILGQKLSGETSALLRREISSFPGVIRIESFDLSFNGPTRELSINSNVLVQPGPGEQSTINLLLSLGA